MAQSMADIIGKMKTSIHGRRFGLDNTGRAMGITGTRKVVTAATSDTTGTALPNHGLVTVHTSTNDTWALTAPEAGCDLTIIFTGTTASTGIATIAPSTVTAATIQSCGTSTGGSIKLTGNGASVSLMGLSTSVWAVTATRGSTTTAFVTT